MRRSTWIAVSITVAVLAGAGLASRPASWNAEAWRDGSLAVLGTLAAWAAEAWTVADETARQVPVPVAAGITIGGGLLLVVLGVLFRPRARRAKRFAASGAPRASVPVMARVRHRSPRVAHARRGRVALDAVRLRKRMGRA